MMILEMKNLKKDKYEQETSEKGRIRKRTFRIIIILESKDLENDNSEQDKSEKGQIRI